MATLRNKRNLAAVLKEAAGNTRNNQSQNTPDPGMAQKYISQVSEEIEGWVIKKLPKNSAGRSHASWALSLNLMNFFWTHKNRTCSVAVPETSRKNGSGNQELTGDRYRSNHCAEAVFSACHSSNLNESEQEDTHHMVTRVLEQIPYSSPGTFSGEQKKARSTSQPQFCSENNPVTIEAVHIWLALQQLAINSTSANFNNNINRISMLP